MATELSAKDAEIERLTLLYRDVVEKLLNAPPQTDDIVEELDAKDAEIAALKDELATVTTWARMAYAYIAKLGFRHPDDILNDAPVPVRGEDTDAN